MRVHLAKGRVKVTRGKLDQPSATPGIEMLPGQTLEATPTGERILTPPSARVSAVAAPAMDRMVFRDQSLASAVDQFNRTSRIKLETDPRIGEFRIRGSFRTGDGARFARALAQLYPIRVERRADGALLLLPHTDK
jgi:transmembrane sensor